MTAERGLAHSADPPPRPVRTLRVRKEPHPAPPPRRAVGAARRTAARAALWALRALGLPALLVAAWWGWSARSDSLFVSSPREVADAFADVWFSTDRLTGDVLPSVGRLLAGYALAAVAGVALGVAVGSFRTLRAALEPALEFFRAVPPPVLVPLIMLFSGVDTTMKVLVIASGCVWPVLLNTTEGVRALDEVLGDTARCFGVRGVSRLRHLVLRGASPQIMAGLRQALSIGIILMVIGEMFASTSGLGHTIVLFQRQFAIAEMWSGVAVLGLLGLTLSLLFRLVERRVLSWYHDSGAERGTDG